MKSVNTVESVHVAAVNGVRIVRQYAKIAVIDVKVVKLEKNVVDASVKKKNK